MIVATHNAFGTSTTKFARLLVGPAGAQDSLFFESNDLNEIIDYAEKLRDQGANRAITVELCPIRYRVTAGAHNVAGIEIIGRMGTEYEFVSVDPIVVSVPSMSGYPTMRTVTTACLGLMLRADRSPIAQGFKWHGGKIIGHTGTARVAGHYTLVNIVGDDIDIKLAASNETSVAFDSTAVSPYKALSARNFSSLTILEIGEDRWVEPSPKWARQCSRVNIDLVMQGEPLLETSGASNRLIGCRLRKCSAITVSQFKLGSYYHPSDRAQTDIIFTGQPADTNTLAVNSWDPFLKRYITTTYEFDNNSAITGGNISVTIGATALATSRNLADAVRRNRADYSGTAWANALNAEKYLDTATGATIAAIRVEGLSIGENDPLQNSSYKHILSKSSPTKSTALVSGTPANVTIRTISAANRRSGFWMWGLVREDCGVRSIIRNMDFGTENFSFAPYLQTAYAQHNEFDPNEWSEQGHAIIDGVTCEGCTFGEALLHIRDSGFTNITATETGQTGGGVEASTIPWLKIEPGMHSRKAIVLAAASQPTDGDKYDIVDGNGHTVRFEFDNNSAVTGANIPVTIGADGTATMRNFRAAIESQYTAHLLECYADDVVLTGGTDPSIGVFFVSFTKNNGSQAINEITDAAAKLSTVDISQPYRASFVDVTLTNHWHSRASASSTPIIWAEKMYGKLGINMNFNHVRKTTTGAGLDQVSQAVWLVQFTAVLTTGSTITLDSIAAGAPGVPVVFHFEPTGSMQADDATNKWIDVTINNTLTLISRAFAQKVRAAANDTVNPRSFYGFFFPAGTPTCQVIDGTAGNNAGLVAKAGGNTGAGLTISGANLPGLGLGPVPILTQGQQWPIVLKDVAQCNISGTGHPFVSGTYTSGTATFVEGWDTFGLGDSFNESFGGLPMQLFYIEKSSAAVTSKVTVSNLVLNGPWGPGRQGKQALYDLGTNMVDADITVPAGSCVVNGMVI